MHRLFAQFSPFRTWLCGLICCDLWLCTPYAWANYLPAKSNTSSPINSQDPENLIKIASERYQQGEEHYAQANFASAIQAWNEALALLPEEKGFSAWRASLLYLLATAHRRAYEQNADLSHLEKALNYLDIYVQIIDPTNEESRLTAVRQQDEIREILTKAKQAKPTVKRPLPPPQPLKTVTTQRSMSMSPARKHERILWINGGIFTGLGAGLLATMSYGLARGQQLDRELGLLNPNIASDPDRTKLLQQGHNANTLAIVTGIAGGVILTGGLSALVWAGILQAKYPSRTVTLQLEGFILRF